MSSQRDLFVDIIDIIIVNDLTTTGQIVNFFLYNLDEYRSLFRFFVDHYDFFRDYLFSMPCGKELLNE